MDLGSAPSAVGVANGGKMRAATGWEEGRCPKRSKPKVYHPRCQSAGCCGGLTFSLQVCSPPPNPPVGFLGSFV